MKPAFISSDTHSRFKENLDKSHQGLCLWFQLFFYLNVASVCLYTTWTAFRPFLMLATHIIMFALWGYIKVNASDRPQFRTIWNDAMDVSTLKFAADNPRMAKTIAIIFLFVLTPLRVYASGANKGVATLFLASVSIIPMLAQDPIIAAAGLIFGCIMHSPIVFGKSMTLEDAWLFMMVGLFHTTACYWYTNRSKSLREINHAKNMFLSNIGHEVRTPLHGITGSIEALRTEVERLMIGVKDSKKVFDWLEVMQGCAISLSEILDNMVLLSKLDPTNLVEKPCPKEEFALRPFLRDVANLAFAYPKSPGVVFRYSLEPCVPNSIITDRVGLRQVLTNLVTNSLKFTTSGSVVLRVYVHPDLQHTLCFELSDTGCGMSEEFMQRLFKPFSQENAAPVKMGKGAGLGLFISATIARRMGALINVKSKKGLGTTMYLNLPQPPAIFTVVNKDKNNRNSQHVPLPPGLSPAMLARRRHTLPFIVMKEFSSAEPKKDEKGSVSDSKPAKRKVSITPDIDLAAGTEKSRISAAIHKATSAATSLFSKEQQKDVDSNTSSPYTSRLLDKTESKFRQPRALVVDDSQTNIKVLLYHLNSIGFSTASVTSGEEAVEAVRSNYYDIIFLDVYMPGMGGLAAARMISRLPNAPKKIVACSADTQGAIIAECKKAGMTEFLGKPFKKEDLKTLYDELAQTRRLSKIEEQIELSSSYS